MEEVCGLLFREGKILHETPPPPHNIILFCQAVKTESGHAAAVNDDSQSLFACKFICQAVKPKSSHARVVNDDLQLL